MILRYTLMSVAAYCAFFMLGLNPLVQETYSQEGTETSDSKKEENAEGRPKSKLSPVPDRLTRMYQDANAALVGVLIDIKHFRGPHEGPGIVSGLDGPLFVVEWFREEEGKNPRRLIPFSSIIAIDQPMRIKDREGRLVYYHGPLGEIEFGVLLGETDFMDKLVKRWKSYLLSQERL